MFSAVLEMFANAEQTNEYVIKVCHGVVLERSWNASPNSCYILGHIHDRVISLTVPSVNGS